MIKFSYFQSLCGLKIITMNNNQKRFRFLVPAIKLNSGFPFESFLKPFVSFVLNFYFFKHKGHKGMHKGRKGVIIKILLIINALVL